MKTNADIGIGINSIMEICIPKYSELPYDFECEIKMSDTYMLSLYEGNRFYVKDNVNIGNYNIYKKESFIFKLKMSTDYILKVYVNDDLLDEIQYFQTIYDIENEIKQNETDLRDLKNAKDEYRDFIVSTLSSIEELILEKEIKEFMLDRLKWAKDVLEVEDVTCQEYRLALQEIESIVNPILKPFLNKPMIDFESLDPVD
jgi:hypothetical protein